MPRPKPPMYRMVSRKTARNVNVSSKPMTAAHFVQKQKALQESLKQQQEGTMKPEPEPEPVPPEPKILGNFTPPKPEPKEKSNRFSVPKIEWYEDMTRRDLYLLAKEAGLDVRSKDSKSKIVQLIDKYNQES